MIRPGTLADVPALVELGRLMHAESPRWRVLEYVPEKVAEFFAVLVDSPRGFVRLVEIDGEIVGGIVAAASEHWFSHTLTAFEIVVYVAPPFRGTLAPLRLLKAYRAWGESLGCYPITAGVTTLIKQDPTIRLYELAGMQQVGPILEFPFKESPDGNRS